jgi:hypothetical protein
LLTGCAAAAAAAVVAAAAAGPVVVNEVLVSAANETTSETPASWSVIATTTDWFELFNTGSAEVDISGWMVSAGPSDSDSSSSGGGAPAVTASDGPNGWRVPPGVRLLPGAFLLVLCPSMNGERVVSLCAVQCPVSFAVHAVT